MTSRALQLSWVLIACLAGLSACGSASRADKTGERITVTTHCGVLGVTVAGRVWLAAPVLGDHNPPAGWDDNENLGSFVRTSATSATFTTDSGLKARFRLADAGTTDPNNGCE